MSKLTTYLQLHRSVPLMQDLQEMGAIAFTHPREVIVENPYTGFASVFATIGSLCFSAYAPSGIWVIFILSLLIFLAGLVIEATKYKIYTQNALPIPVVINISNPADNLDALNSLFSLIQSQPQYQNYQKNLAKYLSIEKNDLVYKYEGNIFDRENLQEFLKFTKHDLERVKRRMPQNSTFYLVYIGPISVAFLVGSMLAREGMLLLQKNQTANSYRCVMEVKDRTLKESVTEFEKFEVTYQCSQPPQSKVTVAIDTAAHKIKLNDPSIQSYGDIICLRNRSGNSIDFNEDWLQYCREIFQVLNEAQQTYQEIKLVYSMPVNLAIAVGMAIQHFWNIQLTNYDGKTGTYQDFIKMNDFIYFR